MEVKEIKLFEFTSGTWNAPSVQVKKNDIIKIEYNSLGDMTKTVKGRFCDLEYSEVVVLDVSREFFSQKLTIPLSNIIYIEKVD